MKLLITVSILIQCTLSVSLAQPNADPHENFDEGEYFYKRGDYQEAVYFYLQLLNKFPDNANYNFKIGECYLKIPGKETYAIPYLEQAVKNITTKKDYKGKSFDEDKAPLHAYFYLGNAYRINNQLNKALSEYNTFTNSPYYYGNYNQEIVENEIKSCERAKIIQDSPVKYKRELLPADINTSETELDPVVSNDENSLVFIRKLKFYDAVFFTVKVDGKWAEPVNISPQIGSDGDFYPTSLSSDGKELYLVKRDNSNNDLYVSRLDSGIWSKVEKLGRHINSGSNETHASISEDGTELYFTSDRKGRKGFDIYVSKREKNGEWGRAKNLGKTINTDYDEATPFITNNGKTLFFSSKGHYNMGGYDIFYSNRNGKEWSNPINLGYPINDTGDNLFFDPVNAGAVGYMSRVDEEASGNDDIYRYEILSNLMHLYEMLQARDK